MCIKILSKHLAETFHLVGRTERVMTKLYTILHVTCPLFLSHFNENLIFSTDFLKIFKYKISWNLPNGSQVFPCGRIDGRTDR